MKNDIVRRRLFSSDRKRRQFLALATAGARRGRRLVLEQLEDRAMLSFVTGAGALIFTAFPGEPNDVTITPGVFTNITDNPNISLLSTFPSAEFLRGLSIGVEVSFIVGGSFSSPLIPFDLPNDGVVAPTIAGFGSMFTGALQSAAEAGSASVVAGATITQNGNLFFKVTADGDDPITDYKLYNVIADGGMTHPDSSGGDLQADSSVFRAASPGTGRVVTGNVSGSERDRFSFDATTGNRYVVMLDQDPERDGTITSTRLKAYTIAGAITNTPLAQNISLVGGNAIGPFTVPSNQKIVLDVENAGVGAGSSYRLVVAEFADGDSVAQLEGPQTIASADPALPRAIPDQTTVTSTLAAAGFNGSITDVDVKLNIAHTFDGDLDVFLISPSGTRVELFTDVGSGGDNFTNTTLDDGFSFNPINSGTAPFNSTFSPEGLLSALNGEDPNGTWTLEVTDDAANDTGTLNNWSLTLTTSGNTDTTATATALPAGNFGKGAIDPARDIDFWRRAGATSGALAFAYVDTSGSPQNKDSRLELIANDGITTLEQADDGGPPGVTDQAIKDLKKQFEKAGLQSPSADFPTVIVNLGDRDDRANLRAVSLPTEIFGGTGLDTIIGGLGNDLIDGGENADLIEGSAGDDLLKGGAGDDTFIVDTEYGPVQTDTVFGGDGSDNPATNGYDTIFVPSSAQKNDISVSLDRNAAHQAVIDVSGVTTRFIIPKNDVDEIQVSGGDGADRLSFRNVGVSDDEIVVYIRGPHPGSGAIYVLDSSGTPTEPPVTFDGIEQVDFLDGVLTRADGSSRLVVFSDQSFERGANDTLILATLLGAGGALNLDPAIFPAGDVDTFQFVAQYTGTLDFRVFFEHNVALPGNGDLNVEVRDANGNLIALGTSSDDDERVTISAVQDQVYFLRVFGATGPAINDYDITVINTPAPVPAAVVLDPADDSGATDLDQVTNQTVQVHYFVHADLNEFANAGITILTPAQAAAGVTPGAAVQVFNEGVSVGFASAVPSTNNTIFEINFDADLANFPIRGPSAAGPLGYDGFLNFVTAAVTMFDGLRNTSNAPTPAVGRTQLSQPLSVTADNIAPLAASMPDLLPSSDSGQFNSDNVTLFNALALQGTGEANSHVVIHANGFVVGQGTVGTDATDGVLGNGLGVWEITTEPLTPASTSYLITARLEDLAGNIGASSQILHVLIDPQGPQVTDVFITGHGPTNPAPYNLFGQKPGNAFSGPTPAVNSLTIRLQDLPNREAAFFVNYFALNPNVSAAPGNFVLTGDATGVVLIQSIILTNDPIIDGQPATASIQLQFANPLRDDRYTLTIKDSVVDPAGNGLDGESNAAEPSGGPSFPSGNGVPGSDFIARFTIDSQAELGAFASGSVYIDTNGNNLLDTTNLDATNRDIVYLMGFTSDNIFAGNFSDTPASTADGFDKLAAYGRVGASYRWLIDTNNDGLPEFNVFQPLFAGVTSVNGMPVAGNFDGNAANGDEVALKVGNTWLLDTNHDFIVDTKLAGGNMVGLPITGDFDGDGTEDLGAWADDSFKIDFGSNGLTGNSDFTFGFGLSSVRERPVAADFDGDGITDFGLWVPDRAGIGPNQSAEWYLFISAGQSLWTRNALNGGIFFKPAPFGADRYAQFGDEFGLPIPGNFDPPITPTQPSGGFTNTREREDVDNDGFVSPIDALLIINKLNSGDTTLVSSPFSHAPFLDVNGDGSCAPIDALIIINKLNAANDNPTGEGEGESADSFFAELGSGPSGDDSLSVLLAIDDYHANRKK